MSNALAKLTKNFNKIKFLRIFSHVSFWDLYTAQVPSKTESYGKTPGGGL